MVFSSMVFGQAHQHGQAEAEITLLNNDIALVLRLPAESVIGFEHQAKTDQKNWCLMRLYTH